MWTGVRYERARKISGLLHPSGEYNVRPRGWMHEALMKSIGRANSHQNPSGNNITSWNVGTGFGRHHAIALNAETVEPSAYLPLSGNGEISSRVGLRECQHCTPLHQATITFP